MGRIVKNKNVYSIYVDGKDKPYTLDVNTGVLVGLRGVALSTIPSAVKSVARDKMWDTANPQYMSIVRLLWNGYLPSRYAELYSLADRLESIGYSATAHELTSVQQYIDQLQFKDLVQYLKADDSNDLVSYVRDHLKQVWLAKMGLRVDDHLTQEMLDFIYSHMKDGSYTKEDYSCFAYFLSRGLWEFFLRDRYYTQTWLRDLKKYCVALGQPMEKSDFFRQYINAQRAYEQNKAQMLDNGIRHYQLSNKALAFENDIFEVVIPTTNAELVAEGNTQHNCVGGYGNRVAEGSRYVVFIRRKSDPTKSYITCDIYTNGIINQYLTRYNRSVTDELAREFKVLYQNHLSTHWGE